MKSVLLFSVWVFSLVMCVSAFAYKSETHLIVFWSVMTYLVSVLLYFHCIDEEKSEED